MYIYTYIYISLVNVCLFKIFTSSDTSSLYRNVNLFYLYKQTHSTVDGIKHRTVYKLTCVLIQISVN